MFGEQLGVPVVQVSIDGSLSPQKNWAVGEVVSQLRREGILVLSGGLTAHNLRDVASFAPQSAKPVHLEFNEAIHKAVAITDVSPRTFCSGMARLRPFTARAATTGIDESCQPSGLPRVAAS